MINDFLNVIVSPLLIRRAKSDLNHKAQSAAIENFAVNLKNLLQTPPIKGCSIVGIDPGMWMSVLFYYATQCYTPSNFYAV